jgi:hypothetical protein
MDIANYFEAYLTCGFNPIALYPGSKIPVFKDWQVDWSADKYRAAFDQMPDANMGFLLGTVMDVEGDTEEANEMIFDLTRHCPHPMFKSNKSCHHLFLSPNPNITICKFDGIEFRGRRHQSVVPPSVHKSGKVYEWLKKSTFPAPPMPTALVNLLYSHYRDIKTAKPQQNGKKANHTASLCNECGRRSYIHKTRLVLEVRAFASLDQKWQCQKCRKVDVRPICRKVRDQMSHDV